MYKLTNDGTGCVIRLNEDGEPISFIPATEDNGDYLAFLAWVDAGNTPAEADAAAEIPRDIEAFDLVTQKRMLAFKDMTPQQVDAWILANVVDFPSAVRALRDLGVAVSIIYRAHSGKAPL